VLCAEISCELLRVCARFETHSELFRAKCDINYKGIHCDLVELVVDELLWVCLNVDRWACLLER